MHLEEFSAGSSLIHRLDPRIKIIAWTFFSLVTALASRSPVLWAALATSFFLVVLARLKPGRVLRRLAAFNVFVLFLWFFLPFSTPGTAVWQWGSLIATREGLLLTLAITVKSNAIILAVIGLLSTSTFSALIHAASHLKMPDKLVQLFFFTFRYFQVIHQEYLRLRAAMRVRCFTPKTNVHTYRSLAFLAGMLIARSFDRSERIHQAMLCRGFDGRFWVLDHFSLKGRDTVFLTCMLVLTAVLAVGQWSDLLR